MFDFDNLKDKAKVSLSRAALTAKDLADKAGDKAKDVGRIAKLTLEINTEKDVIRKAYSDIGKLYYDTYKDNPDGLFIQLCDEVSLATENISAKEAEITKLKASEGEDDDSIVVEFEEIVDDGECSCGCGCNGDSDLIDFENCCGGTEEGCNCTPEAASADCCCGDDCDCNTPDAAPAEEATCCGGANCDCTPEKTEEAPASCDCGCDEHKA